MIRLAAVAGLLSVGLSVMLHTAQVRGAATGQLDLSRIRILAIAPFYDEVYAPDLAALGGVRLSELATRGPIRIVPPADVATEMKRLGIAPAALVSPTSTVAVGRAVGADAVLTGRITLAIRERDRDRDDQSLGGGIYSRVDASIRVLEVATRLTLFHETFICTAPASLEVAMDCLARDVVRRLGLAR
ncbi:MAG: hypothetical protein QN187_14310 [Armatimonadota bacterium]|nr:hypothetical protein [Armatimonadota bacterium]MDR7549430.1 hypothetical protein [Armatimonadota bacterium]